MASTSKKPLQVPSDSTRESGGSCIKSLKESIADTESRISEAQALGNTRKANALKIILKRLRSLLKNKS